MPNEVVCQRCDHTYCPEVQTPCCPRCQAVSITELERRQIEEAVRNQIGDVSEEHINAAVKMAVALYETDSRNDKDLATVLPGYVEIVSNMRWVPAD